MKQDIHIRRYTYNDRTAVMELLHLNTPQYFAPEEAEDLLQYLAHDIDQYFVLEKEEQIVGCGGINIMDDNLTARISWDLFHPHYQGQGLGTLLLQYRLQKLKALVSVPTIVVRTSQMVYPFYRKNGFQVKTIEKEYWAPGFDMYYMEYEEETTQHE